MSNPTQVLVQAIKNNASCTDLDNLLRDYASKNHQLNLSLIYKALAKSKDPLTIIVVGLGLNLDLDPNFKQYLRQHGNYHLVKFITTARDIENGFVSNVVSQSRPMTSYSRVEAPYLSRSRPLSAYPGPEVEPMQPLSPQAPYLGRSRPLSAYPGPEVEPMQPLSPQAPYLSRSRPLSAYPGPEVEPMEHLSPQAPYLSRSRPLSAYPGYSPYRGQSRSYSDLMDQ